MPCYAPLQRRVTARGEVVFGKASLEIRQWAGAADQVACRGCFGCRLEKSREWSVRIMHELQMHRGVGAFVTLTYDDKHLPPDGSISVRHWQLFAKSFRHRFGPFRYYMCGEYGDQTNRPHYHACIFGHDFRSDRKQHSGGKFPLWTSKELQDCWGKGFAPFGEITLESAAYTARYIMKKITGDLAEEHYQGRTPEFNTMSRGGRGGKGGLGKSWYEKFKSDAFPSDFITYKGRKVRPPKYYDSLLEKEDAALLEQLKVKRADLAETMKADSTAYRLAVRERVKRAQMRQLMRKLE